MDLPKAAQGVSETASEATRPDFCNEKIHTYIFRFCSLLKHNFQNFLYCDYLFNFLIHLNLEWCLFFFFKTDHVVFPAICSFQAKRIYLQSNQVNLEFFKIIIFTLNVSIILKIIYCDFVFIVFIYLVIPYA